MAKISLVPNPGQDPMELAAQYGQIGESAYPTQMQPALLPGSPPFQMPPLGTRSGPGPSYAAGPPQPAHVPPGLPGPIYPGTWPGHPWYVGPAVAYTGSPMRYPGGQSPFQFSGYGGFGDDSPDFQKFFKFGVVDNGLLIMMTALGVGMDAKIAKVLKVPRGWGPLIGASVGNALSDGVAGLADGIQPALGVTLGALLPVVPIFIAANVMKRSPTDKVAQNLLMGSSAALVLWAFLKK